jgi:hypothetical protein
MVKRRHIIVVDRILIKKVDYIFPKLKYSVNFRKIIRWLENFESYEIENAIDFLFFLEFVDYSELTFRMNEQLKNAFQKIPKDYFVFIYPGVATYPKSAEVINYVLKETPVYLKRKKENHCLITRDLEKDLVAGKDTAIILTDDFIGTGLSFEKGYVTKSKLKLELDSNPFIKIRFLISAICMNEGRDFIYKKYPEITIFSEFREKIFNESYSPFSIANNTEKMRLLALKYGNQIRTQRYHPYYTPLGFDASEALIAFSHSTPNNTLPIIWASNNWFPLYPRFARDKMNQSKEIKSEVAFYIGIMNRLGLDLYNNQSIKVNGKRQIKYNKKIDHSLLCVMKLLQEGFEIPSICQILGITGIEYKSIVNYGKRRLVLNSLGKISNMGLIFYNELMKNTYKKRFISKDKGQFEMKNVNYIPKSFEGMS